ncbi:DUF2505 domain-containing protein [Corynebacterium sp. TAE3-ERU12]|uniref:DUF2505 domain-containing protein n=1 Tax=Corynebacterium sp. TAE3-ERU12 TaxID=2849491 RepID=UPI001C483246|nr:DUF2505 domain-containing protein [Corynebacterium sp. TAE3-ERU12]MBV7294526.1 DUF2505 domain-containing protein [Corynebacterium sp. TAE3-ERU12]
MATHTDTQSPINHPAEKVYAALATNEYWTQLVDAMPGENGEVTVFNDSGDGVEVELKQQMPTDMLPEQLRGMVPANLTVTRRETWTALNDDSASSTLSGDVDGFPVSFSGTRTLSSDSLATSVDINVNIPMMGGMIAPKVAEAMKQIFAREVDNLNDYVAKQS